MPRLALETIYLCREAVKRSAACAMAHWSAVSAIGYCQVFVIELIYLHLVQQESL